VIEFVGVGVALCVVGSADRDPVTLRVCETVTEVVGVIVKGKLVAATDRDSVTVTDFEYVALAEYVIEFVGVRVPICVVAIAEGDPVTLVVPIDLEGVRDPDTVAVGQADTEPKLTVQEAEGVATLAELVTELVGFTEPVPMVPVRRGLVDGVNPDEPVATDAEPVTVVLRLA